MAHTMPTPLRVTGVLTSDAQLHHTTGQPPHALLLLQLRPSAGLPYEARLDLGTDLADHMLAAAELPRLRTGALVTVAGTGLEPRTDHGRAVLLVLGAHAAVAFAGLITPQAQPAQPAHPTHRAPSSSPTHPEATAC